MASNNSEPVRQVAYIHFDEMCWPLPSPDLEWRLRYGNPSRDDLLGAASFVAAYAALLRKSDKRRNSIAKTIGGIANDN